MPRRSIPAEPVSWAAAMSSYCSEKCGPAPPVDTAMPRYTRCGGDLREVRERERAVHPVLQRPIDPAAADAAAERDATRTAHRVNRGMERSLTKGSYIGYDPISHLSKFGIEGADRMGGTEQHKGKRCPPEMERDQKDGPPPVRATRAPMGRQYNIIAHRYRGDHEAKMRQLDDQVLNRSGGILAKGRDPVRGTLHDPSAEGVRRNAELGREDQRRRDLHATTARTAHAVRRSEGHNYDIIAGDVYDPAAVDHIDRSNRKGVPMREAMRQQVATRLAEQDAVDAVAAQRVTNRHSNPLRRRDHCRGGFDIVTGKRAAPFPVPTEASAWAALSRTAPAGAQGPASVALRRRAEQPRDAPVSAPLCPAPPPAGAGGGDAPSAALTPIE